MRQARDEQATKQEQTKHHINTMLHDVVDVKQPNLTNSCQRLKLFIWLCYCTKSLSLFTISNSSSTYTFITLSLLSFRQIPVKLEQEIPFSFNARYSIWYLLNRSKRKKDSIAAFKYLFNQRIQKLISKRKIKRFFIHKIVAESLHSLSCYGSPIQTYRG